MDWGLLGPEVLGSQRRMRTLELGAVVRKFNDLAVPGMGGVWFGKQLLLASLGVALAEQARTGRRQIRNIVVANAVEALACWLALRQNGWISDRRLFGRLKMQGKTDVSFRRVSQRGFYVTQPMRMRTGQPLLALGLVDATSERFNAFKCTETGRAFIEVACQDYRPKNRSVLNNLLSWMQGDDDCIKTDHSRQALSPLETLTKAAREILRENIVREPNGIAGRRRNLLDWMEELRKRPTQQITWDKKPALIDADHWRDITVGGRFFVARDAAIAVLDRVEAYLGNKTEQRLSLVSELPNVIKKAFSELRECARLFLEERYDSSPQGLATVFCKECGQADANAVLRNLVIRDGRVLQLFGDKIGPGPAFRGGQVQIAEDDGGLADGGEASGVSTGLQWPEGISVRIHNLFLMNADLCGDLDRWLNENDESADSLNA